MKWDKIDDLLNETSSVLRAVAIFILSLLMVGAAGGIVFALYKGVLYLLANKPWWMKILGF